MRLREQRLWDRMRTTLGSEFLLERVENLVASGWPDVCVMRRGIVLPVELKAKPSMPTRATTPSLGAACGLNKHQLNWWLRWTKAGGAGFILIEIGGRMFAAPGEVSEHINHMTADQLERYAVTWQQFAESLCCAMDRLRRKL